MSHIVTIQTEIRDPAAIRCACRRLALAEPVHRTVELYSGEAIGWAVELPEWRYPLVCQTDSGQLRFDNFEGRWGDPVQLDRFRQAYAVAKSRLEAQRQGHTLIEQSQADGSIRLVVTLGGAQ